MARENWREIKDVAESIQRVKSQRKEMMQVFKELGIKDAGNATEVAAQLFFFLFYFKLESKALKNDLNIHGQTDIRYVFLNK